MTKAQADIFVLQIVVNNLDEQIGARNDEIRRIFAGTPADAEAAIEGFARFTDRMKEQLRFRRANG